jgi:hypothetical protein
VKRGLITWDKAEISPEVLGRRLLNARRVLSERGLPAVGIYSDLWRSNQARFFSNYMPYFNRALLIIPLENPPILLCGLSPRVYSWIRTVTTIEDVRPAGNFARPIFQIASERNWAKLGILELHQLPYDMYHAIQAGPIELVPLEFTAFSIPGSDETELSIRSNAAAIARAILRQELPTGSGTLDHHFVGRLERSFRRAGAEDLIILLTNGGGPPAPASGTVLEEHYSVSVAMEYRGHWVRVSRPHVSPDMEDTLKSLFDGLLCARDAKSDWNVYIEDMGGSYPYECSDTSLLKDGSIFALHFEFIVNGRRLFYGDTCWCDNAGPKVL